MSENKKDSLLSRFKKSIGPGVVTGIADDDPSGIATYAQTGAMFGFAQLWLTLFSFPFMVVVQEMCGRIGMVTGKGLAQIIRLNYSKKILFFIVSVLCIANIFNIGANLSAMAASAQLVYNAPFYFWLIGLTVVTLVVEVMVPYPTYVKVLKYFATTVLAYVITAFVIKQDWSNIAMSTIIPHFEFNKAYLLNIIAMLGTTISPYLFFWQADEEIEEELENGKLRFMGRGVPKITKDDVKQMRSDTIVGMFLSNLIAFFVITTSASTLHASGVFSIASASDVAEALRPLAGDYATIVFALGIIGTGMLAVPVLAGSAAYAIAESFGWKEGLGKTFSQAKGFYSVIILATVIGASFSFSSVDPMIVLYYAAILNGLLAPPLLIIILLIANNKKILGEYTNKKITNILGWIITIIMSILSIIFFATLG